MDQHKPSPLVTPAPDLVDREFEPLFGEPFASLWATSPGDGAGGLPSPALRGRLLERTAASRAAARAMHTTRQSRRQPQAVADGVQLSVLYQAAPGTALRPGEPLRALLLEFAPGSVWAGPGTGAHREWLLLRGSVRLGQEPLGERDYHVDPAGHPTAAVQAGGDGALLFLRESDLPAGPDDAPSTVRDHTAGWPDYAPGIRRRVLWQRDGQAAMLYHAAAGASVPRHRHGHDEECLMVQGELFLDDVLLQAGDYQLAPAGTGHGITETDTGVVIYAHGDLELQFLPAAEASATPG